MLVSGPFENLSEDFNLVVDPIVHEKAVAAAPSSWRGPPGDGRHTELPGEHARKEGDYDGAEALFCRALENALGANRPESLGSGRLQLRRCCSLEKLSSSLISRCSN